MKKFVGIAICCAICVSCGDRLPEWQKEYTSSEIREMFKEPPMFYAPHTFWFWDDTIRDERFAAGMAEEMARQRLNPGYAHPRSGFDANTPALPVEQYLSDTWFNAVGNAVQSAKRNGMTLGYCDDYNWPSGQAAGRVLEQHPDLEAEYLWWTRYEVKAGDTFGRGKVDFVVVGKKATDGKLDAASLQLINGENDSISWKAPEGNDWILYTYKISHHPGIDGGRVNYLNPKLMEVFIPMVHEQYAKRFGTEMGTTMPGVFVDNEGDYGWQMAWSDYLAERYQEKTGRDMRLWLPLLTENDKDGLFAKARYDWFDVVSDVYIDCYFSPLVGWLKERNMYYISNLWEESLQLETMAVGDLMRITRAVTMPGNDCLEMKSQDVHDFKEVQSVAEFEGRPFMSEIMGVAGWVQTPEMMKMTVNSVTSFGVSHIVPHGIYMNRKLETVPFPTDWFTDNPYWPYMHYWTDFARRASFVTRQSSLMADVLLVSPMETVWAFSDVCFTNNARNEGAWDKRAVDANVVYSETMRKLNEASIDFLIGDKHYLENGKVTRSENETKLTINGHDFYAVVLPPVPVISRSSLNKIAEFAETGGTVIALGELPVGSPDYGLNDSEIQKRTEALKAQPTLLNLSGEPDKQGRMIAALRENVTLQMRFERANRLYTAHRNMDGTHLYWMANNTDTLKRFTAWLRDGEGRAEIWDCETGEIRPVVSEEENGYQKVSLTLNPYEAYWLAFNPDKEPLEEKAADEPEKLEKRTLGGKWHLSYVNQDTVRKVTAKVLYTPDVRVDEKKLQPDYDAASWIYYAKRSNLKDKHVYWRMNIPIGAREVILPEYMLGRDIWIDGNRLKVEDRKVTLPTSSGLLGFVMNEEEQKIPLAPIAFVVGDTEVTGLRSWYEWGLQQYTGYVDYTTTVTLDEVSDEMLVELDKVRYMAEVFVNGESVGARLWPPFRFDVSDKLKKGENKLTIRVGNLIANRMWMLDDINQLRLWQWGIPNLNLYDAGISGSVSLSMR